MGKPKQNTSLVVAALGSTVGLRVGKATGLTVGQIRCLCGVQAMRLLGLRVSASLVCRSCGWSDRSGRAIVRGLMKLGYLSRVTVGTGSKARLTLELSIAGLGVVAQYQRAERAAIRAFLGSD